MAFKIESHNHPSAVEPYQGAATGVGGILRDVFTMGARPIAMLNSLRFGSLDTARNRYLFAGVVRGVGDYGNCVGIPTLGGEVNFAEGYTGNPLVNAMCVGLLREDQLITARAHGVGNVLLVVGARTGRDGIHGASFASEELCEKSEARRPQVQVGDPFCEKLLLEASLELIHGGYIVAIQDMGAAGLTSSSAEMAARGGVGVQIDTALVPTREPGMTPYEILLSESQERMLVVAEPGRVAEVQAVCAQWELGATPIGHVTDDGVFRVTHDGLTVVAIPGQRLVDDAPVYYPEAREVRGRHRPPAGGAAAARAAPASRATCEALLDTPTIASKRWVYEQYDSTVQASTAVRPGQRRRRGAGAGHQFRHRRDRRLQQPARGARSLRGRQGDRRRGGAQHRLHRRGAAGHHRLPQLRQSREARGLLPVPRGLPRHRGRVSLRSARRSRAATSRSTMRTPAGRSTRPRPSAWSACSSRSITA